MPRNGKREKCKEGDMKKKILPLLVAIATTFALALTWFMFYGRNDANTVLRIPPGFVHLNDNLNNGMSVMGFETQVAFLDADGVGIYSTSFKNSDFIVKYKGEYYVNEGKLLELIEIAAISPEQRRKVYSIGDEVEIRGADRNYYVTITGVEESIINDSKIFDIKFSVPSDVSQDDLKAIFSFVEITVGTTKGTSNMFSFIDEGTVRLEMQPDRKIYAIILNSPDYPGLTYKVLVDS